MQPHGNGLLQIRSADDDGHGGSTDPVTKDNDAVHEGDELGIGGPVTLRVRSNAPPDFTTTIFAGSHVLTTDRHEQIITFEAPDTPEVYRVEIRPNGLAVPWIMSRFPWS